MFKKLRNKFLIMDMATLCTLFILCFAGITLLMKFYIDRDIGEKIMIIEEMGAQTRTHGEMAPAEPPADEGEQPPADEGEQPPADDGEQPPHRGGGPGPVDFRRMPGRFIIAEKDDAQGYRIIRSAGEFSDGELDGIVESIGDFLKAEENIRYQGVLWRTLKAQFAPDTIIILDISTEYGMLWGLLRNFILIGIAAVLVIFFISLKFANKMIKPMEQTWENQKRFIADASHELKTPLTAINTNIDVLMSRTEISGDDRKWLNYIKSESKRMTKLTNDLLYLARLDYVADNEVFLNISFSEAAEEIMLTMEAVMFENRVILEENIESDVYITADPGQIKQLVMILTDNAVKYTPPGGSIEVSLKKDGRNAVLKVKNDGDVIDKDDIEHIFDRFYRADRSRKRDESGGYGLGLAIAKAIVSKAGGKISITSEPENGTVFKVTIPLAV